MNNKVEVKQKKRKLRVKKILKRRTKHRGIALVITRSNDFRKVYFDVNQKEFTWKDEKFVVRKKDFFRIKGWNPFNKIYEKVFWKIRKRRCFFLFFDLRNTNYNIIDSNTKTIFHYPLSFTIENLNEVYSSISPYTLKVIATQREFTSWIKSLIKQSFGLTTNMKVILIILIIVIVVVAFLVLFKG